MRIILVILLAVFLHFGVGAQYWIFGEKPAHALSPETEVKGQNMKGNIKQIWETRRLVDSARLKDFFPLNHSLSQFNTQGYLTMSLVYRDTTLVRYASDSMAIKFNKQGRIVESIWYGIDSGKIRRQYRFEYNNSENLSMIIDNDFERGSKQLTRFDSTGDEIWGKVIGVDNDSVLRKWAVAYRYDEKGRVKQITKIETHKAYSDLSQTIIDTSVWLFDYDKKGYSEVEENLHSKAFRNTYKYDPESRPVEWVSYGDQVYLGFKIGNKYDEYGNRTEESHYKPDNKLVSKVTMQYQYDTTGNWTKQTVLFDGKVAWIVEREIKYY